MGHRDDRSKQREGTGSRGKGQDHGHGQKQGQGQARGAGAGVRAGFSWRRHLKQQQQQQQVLSRVREFVTAVQPRFEWGDLRLASSVRMELARVAVEARRIRSAPPRERRGVSVLMAGLSAEDRAMAAHVMARELQLVLYRVDLSQVVNKYIGETEKNLSRLFAQADRAQALLFFDEADALFGTRGKPLEVRRRTGSANVALLVRMVEQLRGVAVVSVDAGNPEAEFLATRLGYLVELAEPAPGEEQGAHQGLDTWQKPEEQEREDPTK
jgi:hypothetical protein